MTKQLFIIYDKKRKECANLLYNLLSQHRNIKSSLYTEKELNKLVSREKCLYIGEDCSSSLNFDDNYNELGIHVGYMGAKAWVRCFKFEWDANRLNQFEKLLKDYTEKYKTKKEYEHYINDKVRINQEFLLGFEPWPGNAGERLMDNNIKNKGLSRVGDYLLGIENQILLGGHYLKFFNKVNSEYSTIRKYQYIIGVFKFYEDFLYVFLERSGSDKESEQGDTINESEKKN